MTIFQFDFTFLLLLLQIFSNFFPVSPLNSDGFSLLALKSAVTTAQAQTFSNWNETHKTPCKWTGILCFSGRVIGISLPDKRLHGYIPSEISALTFLRRLILPNNNLSGQIPTEIAELLLLNRLVLSNNSLSGKMPTEIGKLSNLVQLDLSSNLLNGTIPLEIGKLSSLSGTLNLSFNRFSGSVPENLGNLPITVSLDLRNNNLSGPIPQTGSLVNQGPTAFSGNPNLCGFPLQTLCVSSKPAFSSGIPPFPAANDRKRLRSKKGAEIFILTVGNAAGISTVGVVLIWFCRKKKWFWEGKIGKTECGSSPDAKNGEFFIIDKGFGIELEDLLRSSAYVVGKSKMGIVYKVILRNGGETAAFAVRRLSDDDNLQRFKEFESEVRAIGRVRHPNLVRLRACYWAVDEKLLISDFISNGSLDTALHGQSTSSTQPLPWQTRLKIAQGAAKGLAHLHECSAQKYIHGNIKSSKVLLNDSFDPCISSFDLSRLVTGKTGKSSSPIARKQSLNKSVTAGIQSKFPPCSSLHYLPPECRFSGDRLTQKSDIYAFGIVLLELLTGRSPESPPEMGVASFVRKAFQEQLPLSRIIDPVLLQEVHAKEQVIAVFHVALSCTKTDPESRPRMKAVSETLDRIGDPLNLS